MNDIALSNLRINPEWAKLPLFDRKGWKRVRFGDVVVNVNETERDLAASGIERYIGLEHLEPGSLHIRSWGNVGDGTTFTRRCRPGQVLFGKRRAYQRKVAVADFDAVVSGDIYVLAPKQDRLLPELLPFLCLSERFFQHAVGTSAGSLSPRTNWSSLASFEFELPTLDQQRRIAELLWAVDHTLDHYDKLIAHCAKAYESMLMNLSLDNVKNRTGALQDSAEFITDGDHNPPKRVANGIPHLVVKHVVGGELVLDDCTYISAPDFERVRKRYDPLPGDIVVTCVGTIGRVALVAKNFIFSADRSLVLIRPAKNRLLPEFGKALLESASVQEQMAAKAIGTAQKHLYLKDIRSLCVAVPDVNAQMSILSRLEPIRRSLSSVVSIRDSAKSVTGEVTNSVFVSADV